jgi:hypothetical protein
MMLLNSLNEDLHTRMLELMWRQWTALGVHGYGASWEGSPIDPDSLLLFSCTAARQDARLFDAVVEWMEHNGRYVGVARVRRMLGSGAFAGEQVFHAVVHATADSESAPKWERLARRFEHEPGEVPLFHLSNGKPLPVVGEPDSRFLKWGLIRDRYESRGVAGMFDSRNPVSILLRLRALLGVNARCEILLYLMLNPSGTPRAMARACGYEPTTVVKAMREMADSGLLDVRKDGRHTVCRIEAEDWCRLLIEEDVPLSWISWSQLFGALERIMTVLDHAVRTEESELAQASILRRVFEQGVIEALEKAGVEWRFGDLRALPGAELVPHTIAKLDQLLQELGV